MASLFNKCGYLSACLLLAHIPKSHCAIQRCINQQRAVGAECDALHLIDVICKTVQAFGGSHIPNNNLTLSPITASIAVQLVWRDTQCGSNLRAIWRPIYIDYSQLTPGGLFCQSIPLPPSTGTLPKITSSISAMPPPLSFSPHVSKRSTILWPI